MVDEKAQLEEGLQNQEKSQKELDDEIQSSKKRQVIVDISHSLEELNHPTSSNSSINSTALISIESETPKSGKSGKSGSTVVIQSIESDTPKSESTVVIQSTQSERLKTGSTSDIISTRSKDTRSGSAELITTLSLSDTALNRETKQLMERQVKLIVERQKHWKKEQEEEIQEAKKRQAFQDDIGVLISMVSITVLAIIVVIIKVMIFSPDLDTTMTTFRPMQQSHQSNIKYTGNGYIPCNGVVPCDPKVCPETCPEANE